VAVPHTRHTTGREKRSWAIRPADARILDTNAGWLKENPKARILIEGHCDERGTNEYNLALGERRAEATRAYLASRGIAGSRMTIISARRARNAPRGAGRRIDAAMS
jgi:peptidoglycan-associated lipoprotein